MGHTTRDKERLLNRVRRLRGQVEAIERALDEERDCDEVMHLLAACRGAMGSLTAEILEGHVRSHIVDPDGDTTRARAAHDLIEVLRTYVR
jgi:DNA-binding FrmR family transcriptional regulator